MKVKNKVLVITGAASGIGRSLVHNALARGARVAAVDLRQDALAALGQEVRVGAELSLHAMDISDRERVLELPQEVEKAHGQVDGLINNAGIIHPFGPFAELDFEIIDRVLKVNLYGTINMLKAFLPSLQERSEAHIVNVASMGAFIPFPGQTLYGASKAAVKLLTEGLYAENMDGHIGVSLAMPGGVESNITGNSGVNNAPTIKSNVQGTMPDTAATNILDGIESKAYHILIGKDAKALYLLNRVAPKGSTRMVQKKLKKLMAQ